MAHVDPRFQEDIEEDDELEEAHEGRGLAFFVLSAILSILIIGSAVYGLRSIINRGYLDQAVYAFGQDVSLLPDTDFRPKGSEHTVRIFFTPDGKTLSPFVRKLRRSVTDAEKAHLIVQELFSAPPRGAAYASPLPEGTHSRGFYQIGRTAYVDLTPEFTSAAVRTPQGERLAVYSIVNSLVLNEAGIESVQLLVDGKPIETAWGWLDCSSPLGANLSVVQ